MDLWNLLIVGLALWFGFQWGKRYSRDKQERADRLLKQAEQEGNPERKTKLLLQWYQLTEDRGLRKTFKKRLLWRKKKERRR